MKNMRTIDILYSNRTVCAAVVASLLIAVVCSGCVGYRVGSTLPPGVETLYVPSFGNKTGEPQVETEATRKTIQEFQKDGTLKIVGEELADARLEVTLTRYKLEPLRFDRDQNKTTKEYRLIIGATARLVNAKTSELISERQVEGDATFEVVGDLTNSKRQALPAAAQDLAHDIVESVVEYW